MSLRAANVALLLATHPSLWCCLQQLRQMVDTNVTAVAILTKLFAAGMVERNRGHIINISSVAAHHAYPGTSSSCVLKPESCKEMQCM